MEDQLTTEKEVARPRSRRDFLRYAGGTLAAGSLLMQACTEDRIQSNAEEAAAPSGSIYLGTGDIGILNYAYALEQIEAAFYVSLLRTPGFLNTFPDATDRRLLADIRDHEVAHREFFKTALKGARIPIVRVNFNALDFHNRAAVLAVAKAFEDTGVAAYNGAAELISNPDYLVLAGKIVSVEARHAAWIRDKIMNGSFAGSDVVDSNGLDQAKTPQQVLDIVASTGFVLDTFDASGLPTS